MDETRVLRSAGRALAQGDKTRARRLLLQLIGANPRHETAWLWLAAAVDSPARQQECLERVLQINPNHRVAQQQLAKLRQAQAPSPQPRATPRRATILPFVLMGIAGLITVIIIALMAAAAMRQSFVVPSLSSGIPTIALSRQAENAMATTTLPAAAPTSEMAGQVDEPTAADVSVTPSAPTTEDVLITTSAPTATDTPITTDTPIAADTPAVTDVPTATTSAPAVPAECQSSVALYLQGIDPPVQEFINITAVADSMPHEKLATVIQYMQKLQRDAGGVAVPECAQSASDLVLDGVDRMIEGYIYYRDNPADTGVAPKLQQGALDISNGLAQLRALASGQPTPPPEVLAASTPAFTPSPTPTPLPVGSQIVVDGWQIRVEGIKMTPEVGFSADLVEAAGRFALLFLEVTNTIDQARTFVPLGQLEIQDDTGKRFGEHALASSVATSQFQIQTGTDIPPGGIRHVIAVFDLSGLDSPYVLIPGILANPYDQSVLLDIP